MKKTICNLPEKLQDLSPESARLCLKVQQFMEKELNLNLAGHKILVAFSHGLDSTALLLILHYLSPRLGISLSAAHLNHELRPESAAEAEQARLFCEALGISAVIESENITALARAQKRGIEETGRNARITFLEQTARKLGCRFIAFGHQLNDLAEDILMRLIRGAGWPGLGGMAGADGKRGIIRPLLGTPRAGLEAFLLSVGTSWVKDPSNHDPAYTRNRVRSDILPLFLRENPAFLTKALELWQTASLARQAEKPSEDNALSGETLPFADPTATPTAAGAEDEAAQKEFSREELAALSKGKRLALYIDVLKSMGPGQANHAQLFALDAAFERLSTALIQFAGNKTAKASAQGILFSRKSP